MPSTPDRRQTIGHKPEEPEGHSVGFIPIGEEDEFVVISAHDAVVPDGIAGIRLDDIGGIAGTVRLVLGVDNGIVLREEVGEKVCLLQALQRDLLL